MRAIVVMPDTPRTVIRLFPGPRETLPIRGLYLDPGRLDIAPADGTLVYTNYIVSMDGRIAVKQPCGGETTVPPAIANPNDWRLYQELAAQADILLTSGRYMRQLSTGRAQAALPLSEDPQFADLFAWRAAQGRAPQPAVGILSASLDLPYALFDTLGGREIFILTGNTPDPARAAVAERAGAQLLPAGEGGRAQGRRLVAALAARGFRRIYAIAGPEVLETLITDQVLDRLYLTQVHRLLGGREYDTLLESAPLQPPADFVIRALYHDTGSGSGLDQCFAVFEARRRSATAD